MNILANIHCILSAIRLYIIRTLNNVPPQFVTRKARQMLKVAKLVLGTMSGANIATGLLVLYGVALVTQIFDGYVVL